MHGPLPFFMEESEVNIDNAVVAMRFLKASFTRHGVTYMVNFIQKGTPTAKIFNNESVLAGFYQVWLS